MTTEDANKQIADSLVAIVYRLREQEQRLDEMQRHLSDARATKEPFRDHRAPKIHMPAASPAEMSLDQLIRAVESLRRQLYR